MYIKFHVHVMIVPRAEKACDSSPNLESNKEKTVVIGFFDRQVGIESLDSKFCSTGALSAFHDRKSVGRCVENAIII